MKFKSAESLVKMRLEEAAMRAARDIKAELVKSTITGHAHPSQGDIYQIIWKAIEEC